MPEKKKPLAVAVAMPLARRDLNRYERGLIDLAQGVKGDPLLTPAVQASRFLCVALALVVVGAALVLGPGG